MLNVLKISIRTRSLFLFFFYCVVQSANAQICTLEDISSFLTEEGYMPKSWNETGIQFKKEGITYYVSQPSPRFTRIEAQDITYTDLSDDPVIVAEAALRIERKYFLAKIRKNWNLRTITPFVEFPFLNKEHLKSSFFWCIKIVEDSSKDYLNQYKDLLKKGYFLSTIFWDTYNASDDIVDSNKEAKELSEITSDIKIYSKREQNITLRLTMKCKDALLEKYTSKVSLNLKPGNNFYRIEGWKKESGTWIPGEYNCQLYIEEEEDPIQEITIIVGENK